MCIISSATQTNCGGKKWPPKTRPRRKDVRRDVRHESERSAKNVGRSANDGQPRKWLVPRKSPKPNHALPGT